MVQSQRQQELEDPAPRKLVVKSEFRPSATWEHLSTFSPAKVGYMEKRAVSSSLVRYYQKRFFVASGHYLRYFNNSECEDMLAVIDIRDVSFFVRGLRGFGLRLASQCFVLRCATERERDEWMATLALMRKRSQETPPQAPKESASTRPKQEPTTQWRESMFGPPAASGVLYKWSDKTKKWKPRFCVASGHYLRYYRSDNVGAPLIGAIDLNEASIKSVAHSAEFLLLDAHRFKAVDPETKAAWIERLLDIQNDHRDSNSTPISEEEDDDSSEKEEEGELSDVGRFDIPPPPQAASHIDTTRTKCCLAICTMPQ